MAAGVRFGGLDFVGLVAGVTVIALIVLLFAFLLPLELTFGVVGYCGGYWFLG